MDPGKKSMFAGLQNFFNSLKKPQDLYTLRHIHMYVHLLMLTSLHLGFNLEVSYLHFREIRWTGNWSLRQRNVMFCNGQVNHLTWIQWSCISLAEEQTEGKMPQEASGSEDSGSRGLTEHHQGWNPTSGDVSGFQTSGRHWLQRICN